MQQSRNWRGRLASGRISAACVTLALAGVAAAHAETIVGLTNTQQLAVFNSASPNIAGPLIGITGLATNETLLGMDYRPSTGVLYGLGSANRLYTLNPLTGAATFVAALTDSTGAAPFSLAGGAYGVDFNPVPDIVALPSLRVTSTSGENLRINVNPGSAGRVNVDTPLSGPQGTPLIAGSAYTNPDRDPTTGTALFGIDFGTDSVYQQIPPNDGTLSLVGVTFNSGRGFWDARDWGPSLYNSVPPRDCLRLRDSSAGQRNPPRECADLYGLILVGSPALFWRSADTFDVLRSGQVIASCPVAAGRCEVYIG